MGVQLLVPIKPLHLAKTRLRTARTLPEEHPELVTALAMDTVLAAATAERVREVLVVTSDAVLTRRFRELGVEVLPDSPRAGLNAALRHGDHLLGARGTKVRVGALQADLPALRGTDLDGAIAEADSERSYCADRQGSGTTLLLAAGGDALRPGFGAGSATAHRESGAKALLGSWASLRCDVDTETDLRAAEALGLGSRTGELLRRNDPKPNRTGIGCSGTV
ncbi:2-phospho-L-lactate guanylyltransferase [Actinopolyspora mzabensis]|uniref:Phosphoenolpyruvate guanylyltransferase n=1 Tax=Actinopolyspora mzabensis TaxID=995066 RepID=A0A1G9FA55_ACTMZ|nr:2-phospho-L-lactate guanylyltransferase [Actinopolyspora mzabensis]